MVKVVFPSIFTQLTNGEKEITISALTLRDILDQLISRYGTLFKERILDPSGEPKRLLTFYINGKNSRFLNYLYTEVQDEDEITILPSVSGG